MSIGDDVRDRAARFDVAAEWVLPDLAAFVPPGGRVETGTVRLTTTYYDTASRDLLSAGVTLHRRTGDVENGWRLIVPDGDLPVEVRAELNGRGVPTALRELVVGIRSGEPLRALATLATERTVHRVVDADGTPLAEIDDDRVSAIVHGPRRRTTSWRELEVVAEPDVDLLGHASRGFLDSGAVAAVTPSKLARALYRPQHDGAPDVSVGALIRRYVTEQVDALLRADIDLRRDQDVAHPTRVAIRRLRSVLHVFADVFEQDRAQALDAELSWYAGLLGVVRDREVLRVHLDEAVRALPGEVVRGPVVERIDRMLGSERDAARAVVARAMTGQRYFALVRDLKAWRDDPAFADGREPTGGIDARLRAASAKVHARVRAAAKHAAPEESLHRARKAAKRARYVAELAEPSRPKRSRRIFAEAKALQDRLGGLQDTVIAAEFLLRASREAEAAPGESPFTFGVLWAREQGKARAAIGKALKAVR